MDQSSEKGERLREAASIGDIDTLKSLCEIVDVNSQNGMNGWTALHWAAKRNHPRIVEVLLEHGADKSITNNKGETAQQLTNNSDVLMLFGISKQDQIKTDNDKPELPIVPNYLANPPFPYVKSNAVPAAATSTTTSSSSSASSSSKSKDSLQKYTGSPMAHATNGYDNELVLKARVANMEETDFIEVEMDRNRQTLSELLQLLCAELNVDPKLIHKIRKLPNTIIRKDKDVARLKDFQEVELVLSNKLKSALPKSYGNFNGIGSNIKQEHILY